MKLPVLLMLLVVAGDLSGVELAAAAVLDCGKPPPLANEETRVELAGKAQLLTKSIGAGLGGSFQTSRAEVLSKYPDADRLLVDSYYQWEVCTLANDPNLTTEQRLRIVTQSHEAFRRPVRALHLTKNSSPSLIGPKPAIPVGQVYINAPGTAINSFGSNSTNTIIVPPANPLTRRQYLPYLQAFYVRGRDLEAMAQSRDLSDDQVQTLNKEAYGWLVETNEWIGQHMTLAAAADFKAAHEEFGTAYPLNGSHPNQIQLEYNWLHMDLPQHLNNLRFLMVNDAMDPQS